MVGNIRPVSVISVNARRDCHRKPIINNTKLVCTNINTLKMSPHMCMHTRIYISTVVHPSTTVIVYTLKFHTKLLINKKTYKHAHH